MVYLIRTCIRADMYTQAHAIKRNRIDCQIYQTWKNILSPAVPPVFLGISPPQLWWLAQLVFKTKPTKSPTFFRCPRPYLTKNTICGGASGMKTAPPVGDRCTGQARRRTAVGSVPPRQRRGALAPRKHRAIHPLPSAAFVLALLLSLTPTAAHPPLLPDTTTVAATSFSFYPVPSFLSAICCLPLPDLTRGCIIKDGRTTSTSSFAAALVHSRVSL